MPKSVLSAVVFGLGVVQAQGVVPDAFDAQLGGVAAGAGVEHGVGQTGEVVGGEGAHVVGGGVVIPRGGVGWRTGSPAAG